MQTRARTETSPAALEDHRAALMGHCYRMLGSISDAEDAVQEALLRAWRSLDQFEGKSSLSSWLYKIATNVCLDALEKRGKRERPVTDSPQGELESQLVEKPRSHWLEPIHDLRALPATESPDTMAVMRQSIRLAFVAALQYLPPRQRAALLLKDVLGYSSSEIASCLGISLAAANSITQRARATLSTKDMEPEALQKSASLTTDQELLLDQYTEAFHRYDIDALTALLHHDAILSMPPYTLWLQGKDDIAKWMLGRGIGCKGSRLVPTTASGQPAFGQYRPGPDGEPHRAWSLIVLELSGRQITSLTHFLDTDYLFPHFDLELVLPA